MRLEGIKELFGAGIPGFKGDYSFSDFQAIFKVVRGTILQSDHRISATCNRIIAKKCCMLFFSSKIGRVCQTTIRSLQPILVLLDKSGSTRTSVKI